MAINDLGWVRLVPHAIEPRGDCPPEWADEDHEGEAPEPDEPDGPDDLYQPEDWV